MPTEPAAVVGAAYAAFAAGGLDDFLPYYAEDVDWRAIEGAPDDVGPIRGRDALRRYIGEWVGMFDDLRNVPQEFRPIDDERVLVHQHITGGMKGSDTTLDLRYWVLYTVRDGLIVRGREYATEAEALAAAG